jgi:CDP-diglyceride synthetase
MTILLKVAGWYNILAGLSMMLLYHEGFQILGLTKPEMNLPIQLVGLLVAIFGVGYLIASARPVENRNLVLVGFLSKLLGPVLAVSYIASGQLPVSLIPVLFLADLVYLVPFWIIIRTCQRLAAERDRDGKIRAAHVRVAMSSERRVA